MADQGLVFTVDGKRHELNFDEITGRDAKLFRDATGISIRKAATLFVTEPDNVDLDTIAGIIWLSRHQSGDQATYDSVLDEITYGTQIAGEATEVDPPEV